MVLGGNYFFRILKFLLRPFYIPFLKTIDSLWDARLSSVCNIKESGKEIFKVFDYGTTVRIRAFTFETKEPETLNWIRGFDAEDNLLDIGANIGIYSL